ncbi:hypothetical protein [Clostridium sp. BSD9I1]|uniref:hypothetical protein n=1 Tax=Clostridium sp. BSD9I1 TaxID=2003589 RepID=UPI001644571B|nr:hypothetical protein [Clostridium sp. BSD9I1]
MNNNIMNYIKTYATYSEVFQLPKYDKNELIKLIYDLPLGGLINVLSQMTFLKLNDECVRKDFIFYVESLTGNEFPNKHRLDEMALFSQQGLLTVWKWLLAYGNEGKLEEEVELDRGVAMIIYLCMIVSDYLYESDEAHNEIVYEMIRNAAFNSQEDLTSSIGRSKEIFIDIAKNKGDFSDKEYVDFNSDFEKKYNYSLKEYLSITFGILANYLKKKVNVTHEWTQNIEMLFTSTPLNQEAKSIIKALSINFRDAKQWAKATLDSPWDFSLFQEKPIFILDNGNFMPIAPKLLYEHVFQGLFYKIRNCYDKNDTNFLRFFGRPFEIYVTTLLKESIKTSSLPYEVIPEFKYGKGNGRNSPDIMVKLGNKLLAIEVKSYRMALKSLIGKDTCLIDKDINKMAIEPFKQLHARLAEITSDNTIVDLSGITEVYLMSVTLGNIPLFPPTLEKISKELKDTFKIGIKSINHLDIEEFEIFCNLISRKSGRPIFRILDNKNKNYSNIPFKNFLFSINMPVRRAKYLDIKSKEFLKETQHILFSKSVNQKEDRGIGL